MIHPSAIQKFRASLRGHLLIPGEDGYETSRRLFNAMIDRRPALVARCAGAEDVAACVTFARGEGLEISVKGGGHNVSGKAVCEGGLLIDLSAMKGCELDSTNKTVRAEAGLTLAELDRATQAQELAVPTGIVSPTGIAGLTLGGGIGWLGGKHGLACDNVLSAEIVTADGQVRTVSEDEHPDLHWGIRGGGGNFGVVTSFTYRAHHVGAVLGGGVAWPIDRAERVLRFYADFTRTCPDELSVNAGLFMAGGAPVVGLNAAWIGPPEVGARHLDPLRRFDTPLVDMIRPMSFVKLQSGGDGAFPNGRRHYWKGGFLRRLHGDLIATLLQFAAAFPSPYTMIGLQQMHGHAARVDPAMTAFVHRRDQWDCLMLSQWEEPAEDERHIGWTRELYTALSPWFEDAVYVNDLGEDDGNRVRSAYGANFERLLEVKAKYDPENLFRANQNITVVQPTREARKISSLR